MERKWIGFSMIIMMLLFGSCGAKDENSEQNSSLATDESVEEEIFQNTEITPQVLINGNIYIEDQDGIMTKTVPTGWELIGDVIADKELPLDGSLYGIGCGKNAQVYYNERKPEEIYIASEKEQQLAETKKETKSNEEENEEKQIFYKKFIVENLDWQYIAWQGNLFVRVSDLLESSRAASLTEEQKNTAVAELPVHAECIGTVIGNPVTTTYPTKDLEMNIPDYNGMNVCRDRDNSDYIYVETFFHSAKRYIVFLKTAKPSVPA